MIAQPIRIVIFQDPKNSKEPFAEWVSSIAGTDRARIFTRLDRVEQGNLGDYKSLGDNLFELRFTFGPGYRVYFGMEEKSLILLLAGGSKSTQDRDIKKARQYWDIYRREN
ncbi:type II toxin-antitoxin system RelE/ParE family toxin [Marispirochaeta sp.]|uniref:type II toxin-antitoxin system RelE/ParE family toxin n=1 Tax=Marispirochaeta sp. TaxID=2038653 RepID=UPI0029C77E81|nr:type II toxin-antitoxin system RelE/ParE family toxin [Marispirochaeta sp.]